jgi:Ca2+-transporting ATPase
VVRHLAPAETERGPQAFRDALQNGLKTKIARSRLEQSGPNRLPQSEPRTGMEIFLEQFNQLPVYLLGAAAGVSVLTGGLLDAAIIMGVVAANAAIGYATESKAEKTINALKQLVHPTADVIRSGKVRQISAEDVVLGDLLVLKPGMYVAADCRIIKASHLSIDESMLTGESMPAFKHSRAILRDNLPLGDRRNMAYMGTLVTGGQGLAIVTATGRWSEIGQLQIMLDETRPPETPIERQLGRLGDQLVIMCMGICGVVFLIGLFRGYGVLQMLRMAISLAAARCSGGSACGGYHQFCHGHQPHAQAPGADPPPAGRGDPGSRPGGLPGQDRDPDPEPDDGAAGLCRHAADAP